MAVLLQGIALYGAKRLRGTTLMVPCLWAATAAACLLLLAYGGAQFEVGLGLAVLRFAVAAGTLCPVIAVLGAKRPQDRGWQWVVASLWLVVLWPAAQTLANPAGPTVEIITPWRMFIVALIAMGPLNYLPTRHWLASLFVAGGQLLLFSRYLGVYEPADWFPLAMICFMVAAVAILVRRGGGVPREGGLIAQNQRWLVYRDAFGAFWGLRVLQRVNETATLRRWPVRLSWAGFDKVDDTELTDAQLVEINQSFDTLLRRFL